MLHLLLLAHQLIQKEFYKLCFQSMAEKKPKLIQQVQKARMTPMCADIFPLPKMYIKISCIRIACATPAFYFSRLTNQMSYYLNTTINVCTKTDGKLLKYYCNVKMFPAKEI